MGADVETHALGGTTDVEDGTKPESVVQDVSTSDSTADPAVQRRGTAFSACFEMFIAGPV